MRRFYNPQCKKYDGGKGSRINSTKVTIPEQWYLNTQVSEGCRSLSSKSLGPQGSRIHFSDYGSQDSDAYQGSRIISAKATNPQRRGSDVSKIIESRLTSVIADIPEYSGH